MALKILFIGGTGVISSAVSDLVVGSGLDLTLFNRGSTSKTRPVPDGAKLIYGDIHNPQDMQAAIDTHRFDVVVNWIAFTPEDIERDIRMFNGQVGQYIFISSASAYQKPIHRLPITEETPLGNPFWAYSRAKQACEEHLLQAYREEGFPATIIRPSHTYDKTLLPFKGGYTVLGRMLRGQKVIVHGDGTSLWVMTHHKDFARGFVGVLGKQEALGEAYHITSDELLTWNQIFTMVAEAAGVELKPVYVPSTIIARHDEDWGASLLGDKTHSVIFDNAKIKALVPEYKAVIQFKDGCQEIVDWYLQTPESWKVDAGLSAAMDRLAAMYE